MILTLLLQDGDRRDLCLPLRTEGERWRWLPRSPVPQGGAAAAATEGEAERGGAKASVRRAPQPQPQEAQREQSDTVAAPVAAAGGAELGQEEEEEAQRHPGIATLPSVHARTNSMADRARPAVQGTIGDALQYLDSVKQAYRTEPQVPPAHGHCTRDQLRQRCAVGARRDLSAAP